MPGRDCYAKAVEGNRDGQAFVTNSAGFAVYAALRGSRN
jgi:hypothetical protein